MQDAFREGSGRTGRDSEMTQGRIVAGLVGAGEFGATFLAQARRIPGLEVRLVCDRDLKRARTALAAAGVRGDDIAVCPTREAAVAAIERGEVALVEDVSLLPDLPLHVVLEATGDPEGGALTAETALANGYHTVLATKETEVQIGPELARRARAAGLVHAPVEGDQPALLIALVARARLLGLPVVAAGKSTESDYVFDPTAETVTCWDRTEKAPGYGRLFDLGAALRDRLKERELPGLATGTVPDLCEMTIVANYCDLAPDRPELHAPVVRTTELPQVFSPRSAGGILERTGVVDVFAHLRRPDELSFAGGVFAVIEAPDPATGRLLAGKGIPGAAAGRYLLLHNPVHLLGVEAVASVLAAARGVAPLGEAEVRPRFDLAARAARDIAAGEVLALGARHAIEALEPLILPAQPMAMQSRVPYYLAAGHRTVRPVARGDILTVADVDLDPLSARYRLRRSQDRAFALALG
jgi:predicted homoserine dehydrogenase-like protein